MNPQSLQDNLTKSIIDSILQIAYWNNLDLEDENIISTIKAALQQAAEDQCWNPTNENQLTLPFKLEE